MRLILKGIVLVSLLGGCTTQGNKLLPENNIAEFSTQPISTTQNINNTAIEEALKRAAFTTLRRGYSHFTLAPTAPNTNSGFGPFFGVRYGRDPYGFGDAGFESHGVALGIGVARPANPRIRWKVTMFDGNNLPAKTPAGLKLYDARALTQ